MPNSSFVSENLTRDEARERSSHIAVQRYQVHFDFSAAEDPEVSGFPVEATITFESSAPGSSTFLDYIHESVNEVIFNGTVLDLNQAVRGSRIFLSPLTETNTVFIRGISRYSRSGEGLHRFVDPADAKTYLYTHNEPADARRIFPNFEQPDLKATFAFSVVGPADWTVLSNAELSTAPTPDTSVTPGTPGAPGSSPTRRWVFHDTKPISTYLICVIAGPYYQVSDVWEEEVLTPLGSVEHLRVPLSLLCRESLARDLDAEALFTLTKQGLSFFHHLFRFPYPFGKYDQVFVPEYNIGAMENPGLVTFTEKYIFSDAATRSQYAQRANTLMHEMSHMWFGDLVTMKWWDDLWLKESFAEYMGALASEQATEFQESWVNFAQKRKAWAYIQDSLPSTHPIVADIAHLEAAKQNFDGITYAKGAAILKQLVAYTGFDTFIRAAQKYFQSFAYANTTLEDFLNVLDQESDLDMKLWADSWLLSAGTPTLRVLTSTDHGAHSENGAHSQLQLVQHAQDPRTGAEAARPQRVGIRAYQRASDGALIPLDTQHVLLQGASLPLPNLGSDHNAPGSSEIFLLPNFDDQTYASLVFDQETLETLLASLDQIDDPLALAVVLTSLWMMVRRGELSALVYIHSLLPLGQVLHKTGQLDAVLENMAYALFRFVAPELRVELAKTMVEVARAQLRNAGEDTALLADTALLWARFAIAVARKAPAPLAREFLEAALSTGALESMPLDDDLRWRIRLTLASLGALNAQDLDRALEQDKNVAATGNVAATDDAESPSDPENPGQSEQRNLSGVSASNRMRHRRALAAIVHPEQNLLDLKTALAATEVSNDELSALIEGLRTLPSSVLDHILPTYFARLEQIWEERSIEIATRVVRGLFPSWQDLDTEKDNDGAAQAAQWLDSHHGAPDALRRLISEEKFRLEQTWSAQAQSRAPLR